MDDQKKTAHAKGAEQKQNAGARKQAREAVFALLYETEYHNGEIPEVIYTRALENREVNTAGAYLHNTYFGIMKNLDQLDAVIEKTAKGWRTGRLSRVSRAILRLGAYELMFAPDVPAAVAINEAVELSKKYDDVKARAFINGVLNAIKDMPTAEEATAVSAAVPAVAPAADSAADSAASVGDQAEDEMHE